jgi:preprotein translocase subunit SecG
MAVFPVLAIGIFWKFIAVLFVLVSILMILVILIQKGRGGGLSGAFGGGMASGLLGSKTGDFLTWVTIGLVGVFLLLAILMGMYYRPEVGSNIEEPRMPASRQNAPRGATPPVPTDATPATNPPAATAPSTEGSTPAAAPAPKPETSAPAGAPATTPPTSAADTNKPTSR